MSWRMAVQIYNGEVVWARNPHLRSFFYTNHT